MAVPSPDRPAAELPGLGQARGRIRRWWFAGSIGLATLAVLGWCVVGMVPLERSPSPSRAGTGEPAGLLNAAAHPPTPLVPLQAPAVAEDPGQGVLDAAKDRRVGEAIRRARASTVTVEYESGARRHVASGVVINDQGEVLSIRIDPPADRTRPPIIARDAAGRRHPARWLATDPDTGLTLLRVDAAKLRPIRQAASDPSLGADVFLIGTPFGLGHSVSRGHIAGLGRRLTIGSQTLGGLIQLQASLHPGDSGALLADLDGGWLGLVRGVGRDDNLGFAIPARDALWVADQLRSTGKVDRAYLGLRFALGPEEDQGFAPPLAPPGDPVPGAEPAEVQPGAEVVAVVGGSPADRAGLRAGDRVTRLDDRPIAAAHELTDRLDRTAAGAELTLEYLRGTTKGRVTIRATSRPVMPVPADPPLVVVGPDSRLAPPPPRAEDAAALVSTLRYRLDQLEKRVEQLERINRDRKSVSNP